MKAPSLALLVVLLCAEPAQGLRCYQCYSTSDLSSCSRDTCSLPDSIGGFCAFQVVKTTDGPPELQVENRFCLPSCPEELTDLDLNVMGRAVKSQLSCCQEDLCNGMGQAAGSTWALVGGLLLSLGIAIRWAPW